MFSSSSRASSSNTISALARSSSEGPIVMWTDPAIPMLWAAGSASKDTYRYLRRRPDRRDDRVPGADQARPRGRLGRGARGRVAGDRVANDPRRAYPAFEPAQPVAVPTAARPPAPTTTHERLVGHAIASWPPPASFATRRHVEAPPDGASDLKTLPAPSIATHRPVGVQSTPVSARPESIVAAVNAWFEALEPTST